MSLDAESFVDGRMGQIQAIDSNKRDAEAVCCYERRRQQKGKVQEGGTSSCRAVGERGPKVWRDEGAGRNQSGFSLRDFAGAKKREAASSPPSQRCSLGRFLGFRNRLGLFLSLGLGCELLLDLGRDGIGVHFVECGGIPKHTRTVLA